MRRVLSVLTVLAVLGTAAMASAQLRATGTVQGRVTDQEGLALPGVSVSAEGPSLIGVQTVFTGADGGYRLPLLPPGTYTVTFELQGFATVLREDVEVGVQRNTTLDISMQLSSVEETITVTGKSPLVDVRSAKRSSDYSDELRNALPESRGLGADLMNLAPEATPDGSSSNVAGSNFFGDDSVAYLVDGVNVTDPDTGNQFPFYSPDMFEVVELTSIGGNADHGKYQGVAFNVVTKSGGNSFHGEGNYFFQNDSFIDDNTEDLGEQGFDFSPPTIDHRHDGTFSIGGPLLEDEVWFFASAQAFYESDTAAGVSYPVSTDADRFLGKVTWQLDADNRLIGSVMTDTYTVLGRPSSPFRTFEQTAKEPSLNVTPNITWDSILSPDAFLEVKYSGFYGYFDLEPFVDLPSSLEDTTGILSGGYAGHFAGDRSRSNIQGSVSYFAEDFAGDHAFKFGAEWERNTMVDTFQYNANVDSVTVDGETFAPGTLGIAYVTHLGDPYLAYIYQPTRTASTAVMTPFTLYAQDDWTVADRVTVNLGVRFDRWTTGFKGGPGLDDLPVTNDLAPRVGVNFDVFGDGRTAFSAFWGRFYEEFHGSTIADFDPQQGTLFGMFWIGSQYLPFFRVNPLLDIAIDPDLTNQYADQFTIGVDHQLTEDLALTARYIHKDNRDILGGEDVRTVFEPVQVTDADGDTLTLYNAVGRPNPFRVLTNNPHEDLFGESFREYDGVQFKAVKRMSNDWSLIASLLIQKSEGNNASDTGSLGARDDPNDFVGYPGEFGDSRRFVSKIQGSYQIPTPVDTRVGWIINWLSGGRTQRQQRFMTFVDPDTGVESRFGQFRVDVPIDQVGSRVKDSQFRLDLRMDKQFQLGGGWGELGIVGDIFNVLNDDTVTDIQTRVPTFEFGEPISIVRPRIYRLGVRWLF